VWQQAKEAASKTISALQAQLRTKEDRAQQFEADLTVTQQRLQQLQMQQELWEQSRQQQQVNDAVCAVHLLTCAGVFCA
jgi:type I site-specific restriction endonuclease